jgi:hypothetical protein
MNGELENQLKADLLEACRICREELNYNPVRFLQMLERHGVINAVTELVSSPVPAEGFTKLWELRALHLTVEAHVIRPKYEPLFTPEITGMARMRLHNYGYEENPENG